MSVKLLWSELIYAGEREPPSDPVDPLAGSWQTYYLQNKGNGNFTTLEGMPINWEIADPSSIDFSEQLRTVRKTLKSLTRTKIKIAKYWGSGVATKQWTPVADRLVDAYDVSPARASRILAAMYAAINDAFVVTWHLKYLYNIARPNQLDRNLAPILCTPRFPAYPSGHSAMSGCAETVLSYFFPAKSADLRKLAEECAISRLYAGVHFPADNEQGLVLGRQIGNIVVNTLQNQDNSDYQPIDMPFNRKRKVILPPAKSYRQVIPYNFDHYVCSCRSKVSPMSKRICACRKKTLRRHTVSRVILDKKRI
ncbi:vanadium-dependent haloperoxidase [Paenibacillus alkalitolerans]|uniref:vanadium-dependent haloperoxidase n=1 Tax=Paenibacillus alkalitolerans TaxID=2799335 RepID=UPI0018F5750C|nr:vanadium-dependent haloperoxidase [Paenibacillus alkalitolerans]